MGAPNLRVSKIQGQYSETLEVYQVDETLFGHSKRALRQFKTVNWGRLNRPFTETVQLKDIYAVVGKLIISELAVQIPRPEKVIRNGVPEEFTSPVLFHFTKWPFALSYAKKILDRLPSGRAWDNLLKARKKATTNMEILKRFRATLLVNKQPRQNVTLNEYKLWFGEFAFFLPESKGTFKGRELGD